MVHVFHQVSNGCSSTEKVWSKRCRARRLIPVFTQSTLLITVVALSTFVFANCLIGECYGQDGPIAVSGKAIDDETGEPITEMMIQAGRIDPDDPEKITWGFSESRTRSRDGEFRTSINWAGGWTARIVADGYVPQAILTEDPAVGADSLEVVIRLKRGKPIRGRVVDHEGNPVADASVYSTGPRRLNLYLGDAYQSWGDEIDTQAKKVTTNEEGEFEIHASGANSIAVSASVLDAFEFAIDPENEEPVEIKLPAPAKATVTVDIEGADEETEIFYQLLTHRMDGFDRVESTRSFKVKNGESIDLSTMVPGKYQFCRNRMHRYGNIGRGAMIDRTFIELKSGETTEINFVRENKKSVSGLVTWPEDARLAGVMVDIESVEPIEAPFGERPYVVTYDSQLVAGGAQVLVLDTNEVEFKTEALEPGAYRISVSAYRSLSPDEMRFSGIPQPTHTASKVIEVTESGEINMLALELEPASK